jgi:hypothetical protein
MSIFWSHPLNFQSFKFNFPMRILTRHQKLKRTINSCDIIDHEKAQSRSNWKRFFSINFPKRLNQSKKKMRKEIGWGKLPRFVQLLSELSIRSQDTKGIKFCQRCVIFHVFSFASSLFGFVPIIRIDVRVIYWASWDECWSNLCSTEN